MRLTEPRVPALTPEEWSDEARQMMDLLFTVGQYNLVSMLLNSLGVQLDEGLPGWEA